MVDFKSLAAERWFGYGRWPVPYWFVGMEPGGDEDARIYKTWHDLGAPELLDLKAHSEACNDMKWLADRPPLQRTWMQLIRLVLGYEAAPADNEEVRKYQRDKLGRSNGDTLLIELSAINARNLSVHVAERESHRTERIATIQQRISENQPKFVVFYGIGYSEQYEKVAGGRFDQDGYRWSGSTLCVLVRHPVAWPSVGAEWWIEKGRQMRTLSLSPQS